MLVDSTLNAFNYIHKGKKQLNAPVSHVGGVEVSGVCVFAEVILVQIVKLKAFIVTVHKTSIKSKHFK